MPRTIQQLNDAYAKVLKDIKTANDDTEAIYGQVRNLFVKNKFKIPNDLNVRQFLDNHFDPTAEEQQVWNKLNPTARSNFTLESLEAFKKMRFTDLDDYVSRGDVQRWWHGKFNDGRKTFYDAWGRADTWGINSYGEGNFYNVGERNTYMVGALYADNYIGNNASPFLNVEQMSGDSIGNRAGQHYVDAYNILKTGVKNANILKEITYKPFKIAYLNDPEKAKTLQARYNQNQKLLGRLYDDKRTIEDEKRFYQPEKLEIIEQIKKISGAIDGLKLRVGGVEENQKAQKNLTDSFFKSSGNGMSMRDELMSQSESLQSDISNISKALERNKSAIGSINSELSGFNKKFKDLKDLYSVSESKLKDVSISQRNDFNALESFIQDTNTISVNVQSKVSRIQKKMDDNSRIYALEKEKILGEIEGLRKKGDNVLPAINDLNTRLANITKAHDLTKNKLLDSMKSLERLNQTQFDEIKNKNEDFKKRYDKDTEQLKRELGSVRVGMDAKDREINNLAGETAQVRELFGGFEKQANVKFKTLFEYNEYTNRQIRKQNTKKLTTLGNIRKAAQPDLFKKAFAGLVRGRFFEAQPILY